LYNSLNFHDTIPIPDHIKEIFTLHGQILVILINQASILRKNGDYILDNEIKSECREVVRKIEDKLFPS